MQKPDKILGKKFVRGKPYYKIKWEGLTKDQSTWESPPSLARFKSMINKYQMKNWGCPLDEKFYDQDIYQNKGFAHKKTAHDKKSAMNKKKIEKKKMEQSQPSGQQSAESQIQQNNQEQTKPQPRQLQRIRPQKKNNKHEKMNYEQQEQLEIIDLDGELPKKIGKKIGTNANEQSSSLNMPTDSQMERTVQKEKETRKVDPVANSINIEQIDRKKSNLEIVSLHDEKTVTQNHSSKDLGLVLPPLQVNPDKMTPTNTNQMKKLTLSSVVHVEIEPTKIINRIVHIHHLEKINMGNHLYLIEYNDKEMKKMTTIQLLEKHPFDFVSFLERRFRVKSTAT